MAEYKLNYTGAQINAALGKVLDGVPYNLLDNSWFANPVNQRGVSSYKGSTYCFDRWFFYSADATDSQVYKRDGNIGLKGGASAASISQRFPKGYLDSSKIYTLAYYDNVNDKLTIKSNPVYFSRDDFDYTNIAVTTGAATFIQWAALYEGSYTADTLPAYQPKGYAAELAECQRYARIRNVDNYAIAILGAEKVFTIEHHGMRIAPTVQVINPLTNAVGNIASYSMGGEFPAEIVSITKDRTIIKLESGTPGNTYMYAYNISADL